jgi:hypothetical protein
VICPYCGIAAKIEFKDRNIHQHKDFAYSGMGYEVADGACPECEGYIVVLREGKCTFSRHEGDYTYLNMEEVDHQHIIFPENSTRLVALEVPDAYKTEYLEACDVFTSSPKASAALSRRLLQKILREEFGIKRRNLADEIEDFINGGNAPSYLNDAIDAVRNIGNFAAHPLKSTSTGEIVDVEAGEAEWLIEVIESLFDFAFVQPKKLEERRNKLNDKLKDLGKPPMKN